jgi:hypothetical protein
MNCTADNNVAGNICVLPASHTSTTSSSFCFSAAFRNFAMSLARNASSRSVRHPQKSRVLWGGDGKGARQLCDRGYTSYSYNSVHREWWGGAAWEL